MSNFLLASNIVWRVMMIKRGDIVEILPEYQDEGDDTFQWIATSDEEKGRVDITPINTGLGFPPINTVKSSWIRILPETPMQKG